MKYLENFPRVNYKFGSLVTTVNYPNLSAYVDIIDSLKDDLSFYTKITIRSGERPDNLSDRLYQNSTYGWTFFLLNDHLRNSGWYLTETELDELLIEHYPGYCINTISQHVSSGKTILCLSEKFNIGSNAQSSGGAQGTVYMKNVSQGQLFVKNVTGIYRPGEIITNALNESITVHSASEAYNATWSYEDEEGNNVDVNPLTLVQPANTSKITYKDYYSRINDSLSEIKVFRPEVISSIVSRYKEALNVN